MKGNLDFVLLNEEESVNKVSMLSLLDEGIRIWKKGSSPHVSKCQSKAKLLDDGIIVELSLFEDIQDLTGSELMFSFSVNGVNFFGKGKIDEVKEDKMFFMMEKNVYRCEKRKNERLLVYPLYKVYALFLMKSNETQNVTYINRPNDKEERFFRVYLNNKIVNDKEKGPLSGLRALDISKTGVSFIANEKEASFFKSNETKDLSIEFEGRIYRDILGEIVYVVDYIDPRFSGIRMFKIGINFKNTNEDLEERLNIIMGKTLESAELDSQFENFFK